MKPRTGSYLIPCIFLWLGFVCAISFMEAWLKFRAPGVTLTVGLSIGQLIFTALNKVEWFFAFLIACVRTNRTKTIPFLVLLVGILAIQTVWLLPALKARVELLLQGIAPPRSSIHFYYLALEVLKAVTLGVFGIRALKEPAHLPAAETD